MNARQKRTFLIGIWVLSLLSPAAQADDAEDMARANDYYDKQQMVDAIPIFMKLAEKNHLPAQSRLGDIMDYTEEDEQAVGWYIMAAFQGDAAGAYGLGRMYANGDGIKKDNGQALYWIKLAAGKDDLNAIKALELAYRTGASSGLQVAVDLKQAQFWEAKRKPLEEARKKADDEKIAAIRKALEEKAAARKKYNEEAAERDRQGKEK
jgi:TPR repeat protein